MDRHIMLLFLSDVKVDKDTGCINAFPYEGLERECETTNESAVRYLLQHGFDGKNITLSKMYVFATDKVQGLIKWEKKPYTDSKGRSWTHIDYFKERVRDIIPDVDDILSALPYDENAPIDKAVDAIVDMAGKIQADIAQWQQVNEGDTVYLHVDCTGGMRHANMMMMAVIRLMQYSGVKIGKILYSNFSAKPKKVEEANSIYEFFDLISGAEEFARFGSVSAIQDYYREKEKSPALKELLEAMDRFAEAIKLCHYDVFADAVKQLRRTVRDFSKDSSGNQSVKVMKQIQKRIYEDYKELLKDEDDVSDLTLIRWCLAHDYLQQALTLYTERIPEVIGQYHLINVAEKGKAELYKKTGGEDDERSPQFLVINNMHRCVNEEIDAQAKEKKWRGEIRRILRKALETKDDSKEAEQQLLCDAEEALQRVLTLDVKADWWRVNKEQLITKVISLLQTVINIKANPQIMKDITADVVKTNINIQFLLNMYEKFVGSEAYEKFKKMWGVQKLKEIKGKIPCVPLDKSPYLMWKYLMICFLKLRK